MTLEQARIEHDKAERRAYTLRGRIESAERQERDGSLLSAQIAEATLPSLRRDLAEAEATVALLAPGLPPRFSLDTATAGHWLTRTDYPGADDLAALEVPDFLRRAKHAEQS